MVYVTTGVMQHGGKLSWLHATDEGVGPTHSTGVLKMIITQSWLLHYFTALIIGKKGVELQGEGGTQEW